ncbi:MAG: helicase HerA-like domain-containing protein [Myxococcota bacterium]
MTDLLLGATPSGERVQLSPAALTTHGFILGMTGSGKTGLCVALVEELLRARVPVIAVDTKGDLATVLLSLAPDDPALSRWTPDAAKEKARIEAALAQAGLSTDAFVQLRATYEPRLFTPGATTGLPVDLLGSLSGPADRDAEAIAEAADSAARGLLGLLGLEADPLTSREYLLIVQLLTHAWQQGQTPTLIDLVRQVATPPFATVGALPLEDFFPQKDRQALMVRLNGLLASPKFAAWRTGEPLDPQRLFFASDGRPRLSVYSVAHLSDEERLFAVALLLERVQGWMRRQGGAAGLRAVVLLDEIFGYFPPAPANPPTKPPLLGLLKQARAFGVSVVLATQNPVDLDYRGLGNIGTWWIGRLQTEQDKQRIRDALSAAASSAGATPAQLDSLIATLEPRQFLLHSVHRSQPVVFRTRDTWSVLHGPFSADEVRALSAGMKAQPAPAASAVGVGVVAGAVGGAVAAAGNVAAPPAPVAPPVTPGEGLSIPAGLEPELGPVFEVDQGVGLPFLLLKFGVRYRLGSAVSEETMHELAFPLDNTLGPAEILEGTPSSVRGVPFQNSKPANMTLTPMPPWVAGLKANKLQSAIKERLPNKLETKLLYDPETKLISGPTESADAFAARVLEKQGLSREAQKLMRQLEKKRVDFAQADKELSTRKAEKWLNVGAGVLGIFSGRRSSLYGVGRALSSHRYQGGAEARLEDLQVEIQQLEHELAALKEIDPRRFEEQLCVPRSSDVQLLRLCYAYIVP